jgi:predicted lipid-binding transport protein (Tim44 family)
MNDARPQFASARTFTFKGPGILAHILGIAVFLLIIAALFFIVLPLAIVLLVVGLIAYGVYRIKRIFRRAHEPNGPLDGRRNVRVVQRDE